MRERYVLTRRGLIARSALLAAGCWPSPPTVAGRSPGSLGPCHGTLRRPGRRRHGRPGHPLEPCRPRGQDAGRPLDERELRPELDRAGAGSARGHGLHGQARPAGPAPWASACSTACASSTWATSGPSEARHRQLATPPGGRGAVRFVWSADTVGQGWGINPDFGGMRIETCARSSRSSSSIRATRSTPTGRSTPRAQPGRQHLARAGRQALAQPGHRGEAEGGGEPARVPRGLCLQPDGREPAALQCASPHVPAVGRP